MLVYEFKNSSEKKKLITENKGFILVGESHTVNGKFLHFLDEENYFLQELEQSMIPPQESVEDAEFELKLITKLAEWGIL